MKSLIWLAGLVFFLALTSAAFVLVPPPGVAARRNADLDAVRPDRQKLLESMRADVEQACSALAAILTEESTKVGASVSHVNTATTEEKLRAWEIEPARREELESEIVPELDAVKEARGLDFLVLVTSGGEVIVRARSANGDDAARAWQKDKARIFVECEPFFRDGRQTASIQILPSSLASGGGEGASSMRLAFVVARPLWVRPDAPHSILLGGVWLESLAARLDSTLAEVGRARLDWHAFGEVDGEMPRVLSGDRKGLLVRTGLIRDLLLSGVSEKPAFTHVGPQVGRWEAFRSYSGKLVGGWGVTVAEEVMRASLAPAEEPPELPDFLAIPGASDMTIMGLILLGGLAFLWIGLALWARFVNPASESAARPGLGGMQSGTWVASAAANRDLLRKLERGWESFSSEMAELVRRKVREPASSAHPGADLQSEIAKLTSRINQLGKQVKAEREAAVQGQVQREVKRLRREWESRIGEFQAEVEEARRQGERLAEELKEALRREEELTARLAARGMQATGRSDADAMARSRA